MKKELSNLNLEYQIDDVAVQLSVSKDTSATPLRNINGTLGALCYEDQPLRSNSASRLPSQVLPWIAGRTRLEK